ncbi:substrate-binding periplasmic protein [Fluviispira multicolorata]|uniref:Transporter substrate-binding domain-containing protein n=1 Tax=Fluviispira multicolorata TaxID=2654512 RepID=A0A833JA68_9BACT|nr:transporter substrate-binding domain-containing protein [Fluviispira multicolorata]KAB8027381.1 transporter substrate-binding domain-containing protein [Fluviispira multicolorata]
MKKYTLIISILIFLSINNKIFGKNQIYLITGNDFTPYSDEKLKEGGMYTYIVKEIFKRLNLNFKIEYLPWARGYEIVKRNKADATFPYAITEQRKKEVKYSTVSLISGKIFIYANIKHKNKKNVDDFKNKIFCNPIGYYVESAIQKVIDKDELKVITKFDAKSCLTAILKGEADFMASNEGYIKSISIKAMLELNKIVPIGEALNEMKLFIIFKKETDDNFIIKFDKEAKKFMATEEYKRIIESY